MSATFDPSKPGSFTFIEAVYAGPDLDYTLNPGFNEYFIYSNPTNGFTTRRIDISDIAQLGRAEDPTDPTGQRTIPIEWPFQNTKVPINGLVRIPIGSGPFPLAVFAHGNHEHYENSTPGYLYICDVLASNNRR